MEITLKELVEITDGICRQGHESCFFRGVAPLDQATQTDISFLSNKAYTKDFKNSQAGIIFVSEEIKNYPENASIIEVENPSLAFNTVIQAFSPKKRQFKPSIHPTASIAENVQYNAEKICIKAGAVIEEGCILGDGSEIGANAVIGENVKIGENCLIYPNVTVREHSEIGDRVILQPNCVIGSDGYGYEQVEGKHQKVEQVGIVALENDVEIGANTCIDRARFGTTRIGEGTKIDNLVQVAHNAEIGKNCLLVSQSGIAGSSQLGNNVTVAAQSGVAGHLKVGDNTILLARSGVAKSLSGGQVYMGFPARPIKEEQKKLASIARLPRFLEQLKELQKNTTKDQQCHDTSK